MDNLLVESILLTKPRKVGDYMVCKVKYSGGDDIDPDSVILQFPKMEVIMKDATNLELEFIKNSSKYNKSIYNFLSKLDDHIVNYVFSKSEEWFNKNIPLENIKQMYNKFIKAPKTSESECTLNFKLTPKSEYIDNKGNDVTDIMVNQQAECISQLKYVVFSKDTCYTVWDAIKVKVYIKYHKVQAFGFIEDPEDIQQDVISDNDDDILINSFF
jgi:hypothetical protein